MGDEGTIRAAKAGLRRQLRAARDALSPLDRATRSRALCVRLWQLLDRGPTTHLSIATYCPIGSEPRVDLLHAMTPPGLRVRWAYPRVDGPSLRFHLAPPTVPGPWQIAEPASHTPQLAASDLNVVIMPGLGFDLSGHRLGYGAGYYDRALAETATNALLIAVCFREQVVNMIPTTHHDHSLHALVTEDAAGAAVAHTFGALP